MVAAQACTLPRCTTRSYVDQAGQAGTRARRSDHATATANRSAATANCSTKSTDVDRWVAALTRCIIAPPRGPRRPVTASCLEVVDRGDGLPGDQVDDPAGQGHGVVGDPLV